MSSGFYHHGVKPCFTSSRRPSHIEVLKFIKLSYSRCCIKIREVISLNKFKCTVLESLFINTYIPIVGLSHPKEIIMVKISTSTLILVITEVNSPLLFRIICITIPPIVSPGRPTLWFGILLSRPEQTTQHFFLSDVVDFMLILQLLNSSSHTLNSHSLFSVI